MDNTCTKTENQAAISNVLQSDSKAKIILMMVVILVFFIGIIIVVCLKEVRDCEKSTKLKVFIISGVNVQTAVFALAYYGVVLDTIKYLILLLIMEYASVCDIKKHEVENFVSVMILISSLIGIDLENVPNMVVSFVITLIFLFIVSSIGGKSGKAIGGADIKIASSLSFFLGLFNGAFSLMLGTAISCVVIFLLTIIKKHPKGKPYALVPFLNIGTAIVLMTGI